MSKTDLRGRPVFHHTRESIEAHLTIVFAVLAIARYLEDVIGLSFTGRPEIPVEIKAVGEKATH